MKREPPLILRESFESSVQTAGVWAISAARLKRAGDLVYDAYNADVEALGREMQGLEGQVELTALDLVNLELAGPATMLFGLAFENVLKAILIDKDPRPAKNGKLRRWPGSGHDLLVLADEAGIALDEQERDLLRRLTAFVEWAGRYPIPKRVDRQAITQLAVDRPFSPLPFHRLDREASQRLFQRLWALVISGPATP